MRTPPSIPATLGDHGGREGWAGGGRFVPSSGLPLLFCVLIRRVASWSCVCTYLKVQRSEGSQCTSLSST